MAAASVVICLRNDVLDRARVVPALRSGIMSDESVTMEFEVSNENVAREVAYGILGRAGQIHSNPHDDFEDDAEELKELAWDLIEQYEG